MRACVCLVVVQERLFQRALWTPMKPVREENIMDYKGLKVGTGLTLVQRFQAHGLIPRTSPTSFHHPPVVRAHRSIAVKCELCKAKSKLLDGVRIDCGR